MLPSQLSRKRRCTAVSGLAPLLWLLPLSCVAAWSCRKERTAEALCSGGGGALLGCTLGWLDEAGLLSWRDGLRLRVSGLPPRVAHISRLYESRSDEHALCVRNIAADFTLCEFFTL